MTRTERNKFLTILTSMHAELARATGRRDGGMGAARGITCRHVRAALERIAEGAYGTCLECDEEISHKRLHAMPWATLCIACQERADGNPRRSLAPQERFLRDAA